MRPVHIDFAPATLQRALLRTPTRAWVIWILGVALGASAAYALLDRTERNRPAEPLRASATRDAQAAPAAKPALTAAQAGAINAAVLQLNLPWPALRDALSAATPAGVALLALEPDAKQRTLKIVAETKTSGDMFAYIARLKRQALFQNVALAKHEIDEQDPNRPIRFQIDAAWAMPGVAP